MVNDPLLAPSVSVGDAQSRLYAERLVPMTRLAYLLTGSRAVAEELVQDAFEQLVRRWHDIDVPPAYLRIAVVNGARSWGRRRHTVHMGHEGVDAGFEPDAIAVRNALAGLPHDAREAIVLRYWVGLSDSEIAAELGRPLGTVKSQIHRGLGRLREELR